MLSSFLCVSSVNFADTTGLKVREVVTGLVEMYRDGGGFVSANGVDMFVDAFFELSLSLCFADILFIAFVAVDNVNEITGAA